MGIFYALADAVPDQKSSYLFFLLKNGGIAKFTLNVTATIAGVAVPAQGLVVAGAEDPNGSTAYEQFTAQADSFQLNDRASGP